MAFNRELEISKLLSHTVKNDVGCSLYTVSSDEGHPDKAENYIYTRIKYPVHHGTLETLSYRLGVHRHMFILKNNMLPCDLSTIQQVSHYCHRKRCLIHLSLESNEVNNQRNTCRIAKRCLGHDGHPNCIL